MFFFYVILTSQSAQIVKCPSHTKDVCKKRPKIQNIPDSSEQQEEQHKINWNKNEESEAL